MPIWNIQPRRISSAPQTEPGKEERKADEIYSSQFLTGAEQCVLFFWNFVGINF